MMGNEVYGWLGGMGGFGMGMGVLFVVVLVVSMVWGIGALFNGRPTPGETPLEILRRRFASGEISQIEFEQARKTLA